jgi:TctA family transporter
MLLPATYQRSTPRRRSIMLAGIYYGAQYGGSTTAILVNLPGESTSVVTTHRRLPDGAARAAPAPHSPIAAWARSSPAAWAPSSSPPSRRR